MQPPLQAHAVPAFEAPDLHDLLDAMSAAELDLLPFGLVRLDHALAVIGYNRAESALSGLSPARVMGRSFFTEVAPCLNNAMVADHYRAAAQLDHALDYVLAFRMRPTPARLRLLARAGSAWSYLCVQPR